MNFESLNLEQFNEEEVGKFDRKTFDPVKNWEHKMYLQRLRRPGKERHLRFADAVWRGIEKKRYLYNINTYLLNWAREFQDGGIYVDAGCGESSDADAWISRGGSAAFGLDLFPRHETLEFQEEGNLKRFVYERPSTFIQQDICEEWQMDSRSVDVVGCYAVIDLLLPEERLQFYRQAYRVLKSGGKLLCVHFPLKAGHGFDFSEENQSLIEAGFCLDSKHETLVGVKP